MEKEVKTQIVKSAQSVKRKFKQLKDIDYDNDLIFGKVFKPLTGPLKTMAAEKKVNNDDSTSTSLNSMQKSDSLKKEKLITSNTLEADSYSPIEKDESDNEGDESSEASFKTLESNHSPRQDSSAWYMSSEVFKNVPYGVRLDRGKHMLGLMRVQITGEEIIVGGKSMLNRLG